MLIDGKKLAQQQESVLKEKILSYSIKPSLHVILVGDYPPSKVYVEKKRDLCNRLGIESVLHHFDEDASLQTIVDCIQRLNKDSSVSGILVQLPLPKSFDQDAVIEAISPLKDVDGLTSQNLGRLLQGNPLIVPCTPQGIIQLIDSVDSYCSGKHAVVLGRSTLVGKPVGQLLLNKNATVTYAHSKTQDLKTITKSADILVVAIGQQQLIDSSFIKKGAIVIDVGITRTPEGKILGDVDFDSVKDVASALTPVPGGVGPMTVVNLISNTLKCHDLR